jgi:hypothetical protein
MRRRIAEFNGDQPMTGWDHEVSFLEGVLQAFAYVNEKQGYSFQFTVSSVDGTDLEDLLTQLYGTSYSTRKLSDPLRELSEALDKWLFRFLTGAGSKLDDATNAFHLSDANSRSCFALGLAQNLLTGASPKTAFQVLATFEEDDETEWLEFAFVGKSKILLIHFGVHELD